MDKKDLLLRQRDEIDRQLIQFDAARTEYGSDLRNGAVIRFRKQFEPGRQIYSYAGIRAAGRWYLTSAARSGVSFSWDELVAWLAGLAPNSGLMVRNFEVLHRGGWKGKRAGQRVTVKNLPEDLPPGDYGIKVTDVLSTGGLEAEFMGDR